MHRNKVWTLTILLILQSFVAGLAVLPSQSDVEVLQPSVQHIDARSNNSSGGNNTNTTNDAHCLIVNNFAMNLTYYVTLDLTNTCSDAIQYPGANASANHTGVSGFSNQTNWFYMIGGYATYNLSWQLSFDQSVTNGTPITLDFEADVLNCGSNNSWAHECPNSTLSHQFIFISNNNSGGSNSGGNNSGGNNSGGNNTSGNNTSGNNTSGNNTSGNNGDNNENNTDDGHGNNNSSGNNSGGNNSGGNAGCGFTLTDSTIDVYRNTYWVDSGNSMVFSAYVGCMVNGEDIEIIYSISSFNNATNTTSLISDYSMQWTVNSNSTVLTFQTGTLYSGTYVLDAVLHYISINQTVDSSSFIFTVNATDSDGDGIENVFDNCANASNPQQDDLDNDGIGDACDSDIDNDNVPNSTDAFPYNASEQHDNDQDGIGDNADLDDDNDGLADVSDAFPFDTSEQLDTDNDGIGNNADADDDADGIIDAVDNCPLTQNADQADADGDGLGTACDGNEALIGGNNGTTGNVSNNVTIEADDVSSIPFLGTVGTLVAVMVGVIATTRIAKEE
mgnify:FL=1